MKPKKQRPTDVSTDRITLAGADTLRLFCRACSTEFEVTHELQAGRPDDAPQGEIFYCPYCGERELELQ